MKKILFSLCAAALIAGASSCNKKAEATVSEEENIEAAKAAAEQDEAEPVAEQDANADESPIVTLPSGLRYKVLKQGKGDKPGPGSKVEVYYTGMHEDGTIFDGPHFDEAIIFPLDRVIPGFSEGLSQMNRGSRYILYIPGELGYGEYGVPQAGIGPNETLVFDVELVDFK